MYTLEFKTGNFYFCLKNKVNSVFLFVLLGCQLQMARDNKSNGGFESVFKLERIVIEV